jgi:hydroxypyruvate reductase
MMNESGLMTHSIRAAPWGEAVRRVLAAAIQAVDPAAAVQRNLKRSGDRLWVAGREVDLSRFDRVLLAGAGKAGAPMARAAAGILGDRLAAGVMIVKEGYSEDLADRKISVIEAGHPLPDERGVQGAGRVVELLEDAGPDDLVIALLSGGGSALLVSPAEGLSLADLQGLTSALLRCGADIYEINALRKHLERLKGGGMARLAAPATLVTLILSDVVGDPLDVIASGPTVPDRSTYAEAFHVLEKYDLLEKAPIAIVRHLERGLIGELPETPKPGEAVFIQVNNVLIGSNKLAAEAALKQAQAEGLQGLLLTTYLQGEARQAGRLLASLARQIAADGRPLPRPSCLVAGGETTVTLHGNGLGGRNQELALGAVADLAGLPGVALVTLATDGGDGPTDAAGAVVTGNTLERAHQAGLSPSDYLARNDAYHFFDALDDLLKPGPTQTNVNDLVFLFAF